MSETKKIIESMEEDLYKSSKDEYSELLQTTYETLVDLYDDVESELTPIYWRKINIRRC